MLGDSRRGPYALPVIDRVSIDPDVCGGRPTIRGLRVTVDFVLKLLADGYTARDIVENYPELEEPDVYAAARYGAWLASERHTVFKAIVQRGRLVLDAPTELPEGTVLELVAVDGDAMTEDETVALNAAISRSAEQARRGQLLPASEILKELRERRRARQAGSNDA